LSRQLQLPNPFYKTSFLLARLWLSLDIADTVLPNEPKSHLEPSSFKSNVIQNLFAFYV
jgi:hypothetical protein